MLDETRSKPIQHENCSEAVVQRCSVKKVFLEISQNSQVADEASAQVFSCEFWEISNNTFFYRTPPVAASYAELERKWASEIFFQVSCTFYSL